MRSLSILHGVLVMRKFVVSARATKIGTGRIGQQLRDHPLTIDSLPSSFSNVRIFAIQSIALEKLA
jgi:hypothetical protein